ncbi:MAG TPA: TIGR03619 family F420-dependent LLM class oxidoreductase [Acidimicrobiia bacterium]|jgi:probable F420-dependent oxidoreductase
MKVRVGFGLGVAADVDADGFVTLVDDLERLGFDSLWLSERVTGPAPDPLVALAVAAGRTRKLKLGTSVQVLPGRNPVLLAKEWASLDRLSGGRALPAFGLGIVSATEQQAFGVTREERAPIFDEALPLIRRFWTEDHVDHAGTRFTYKDLTVLPKPVQQPPDVWLGGRAPSELRRVGRLADGWLPSFAMPVAVAEGRERVLAAAHDAGRDIDPEHWGALVAYTHGELPDTVAAALASRLPGVDPREAIPVGHQALRTRLEEFLAVGFSKLVPVPLGGPPGTWTEELEALAAATLDLQR